MDKEHLISRMADNMKDNFSWASIMDKEPSNKPMVFITKDLSKTII